MDDARAVENAVAELSRRFAAERSARQQRTALHKEDFDALGAAGLRKVGLPVERGGLWRDVASSTRTICELYRVLASGDSSVALVSAMHPAVLAFWLATPEVPEPYVAAWKAQRSALFDAVEAGAWFGTITSEPGSGGDVTKSKAVARRDPDAGGATWRISGQKHFGSGTGVTSFLMTTAVPEGEDAPDWFYVAADGNPFDGSAGMRITAPWDGIGMRATQSHAIAFEDCPAVRFAWPGHLDEVIAAAGPFFGTLFTAVVLGIVEAAVETATAQLHPKGATLRPYEQVELAQATLEAWTARQAYEGVLRSIEERRPTARADALRAKTAVAQLAEACLTRLCRVVGGGTFSRSSPLGNWFEDVRALGFLRPPWALAFDGLIAATLSPPAEAR